MFKTIPAKWPEKKHLLAAVVAVLGLCLQVAPANAQQTSPVDANGAQAARTAALLEKYSPQIGEPHSYAELLAYAEEHAPEVQMARERVGLGEAAITSAEKFQPYNPEIDGEFGVGLDDVGLSHFEVTLTQQLELFGARGLRIEAARQRKKALLAERNQAAWQVEQRVRKLYRLGQINRNRLKIERRILSFTQQLFDVARQRFEAGEEPRLSVIVARSELAAARRQLVAEWGDYLQTLRELGAGIGWQKHAPPRPTGEFETPGPLPPRDALLEKAFAQDHELAVLNARLDQARAELALEERVSWPDPLVGMGFETENLGAADAENTLLLLVGVPIPIWDANQGEIAAARARVAIARQAIENRRRAL
jgi:cobalt-zinc-cadmium efflux system outer membrane protein